MNNFQGGENKNYDNAESYNTSGVNGSSDVQMNAKTSSGTSFGNDRTDEEIIDDMESGEYDRQEC